MKLSKKHSLIILAIVLMSGIVILNRLLIYFEKGHPGSNIETFGDTLWFMIVSLTTVGYGDYYPVTILGKLIGFIYIIGSLGMLGFLISTMSNKYRQLMEERKLGLKGTDFENHIVLIGWNEFSRMVAEEIYHTSKNFAVITNKKDDVDLIYSSFDDKSVFVVFAEYENYDAWQLVNAGKASTVFISLKDDSESLLYVIDFKRQYPDAEIVVSLEKSKLKQTFQAAGVTYAIARNEIASKLVASYIFEPDVANLNNDLLSSSRTEIDFDIQEYLINSDNLLNGKDYEEAFITMKQKHDVVLLGITKKENGNWKLYKNPSKGTIINKGDYLLLMSSGKIKKALEDSFGVEEGRLR